MIIWLQVLNSPVCGGCFVWKYYIQILRVPVIYPVIEIYNE